MPLAAIFLGFAICTSFGKPPPRIAGLLIPQPYASTPPQRLRIWHRRWRNIIFSIVHGLILTGTGAAMRIICALCGPCIGDAGRLPFACEAEGWGPYGQGPDIRFERGSPSDVREGRGGGGRLAATVRSLFRPRSVDIAFGGISHVCPSGTREGGPSRRRPLVLHVRPPPRLQFSAPTTCGATNASSESSDQSTRRTSPVRAGE